MANWQSSMTNRLPTTTVAMADVGSAGGTDVGGTLHLCACNTHPKINRKSNLADEKRTHSFHL
jgi:hypothetical protein